MGGYGSTRWNGERTRRPVEGLLRLDVRMLEREGWLTPGVRSTSCWTSRGEQIGSISLIAGHDSVTLDYRTKEPGEADWRPVNECIWLAATACQFGGVRRWFVCPGCSARRAVLHSVGGHFRCRACHDLAYDSTRENSLDLLYRRRNRIAERLGGIGALGKPPRMHWRTYERLHREYLALEEALDVVFDARFSQLLAG